MITNVPVLAFQEEPQIEKPPAGMEQSKMDQEHTLKKKVTSRINGP